MSADKYAQFIAEQQKKLSVSGTNPVNLSEKKELSDKQKDIAKLAGDEDKIEGEDFKELRDKKDDEDDDKDDDKKSKSKKDDDDKDDVKEASEPKLMKYVEKAEKDTNNPRLPGRRLAMAKIMAKHGKTGVKVPANPNNSTAHKIKEEASYISEEESDYLTEMVAKGKLPEIADFHKKAADHAYKMRVHHQGMADKSEEVGDSDGFEHHIGNAMRHDYDHEHHLARYDHAVSLKARNQAAKDLKVAKDRAAKARDAKRDWA